MEKIKDFLAAPDKKQDEFWESDVLVWIDWREYDEYIIQYFNEKLPDEDKISFECVDIDKKRGVDILLKKKVLKHQFLMQTILWIGILQ